MPHAYSRKILNELVAQVRKAFAADPRNGHLLGVVFSEVTRAAESLGLPISHDDALTLARAIHGDIDDSLKQTPDPATLPGYIPMDTFPFFREVAIKGQHFLPPEGKAAASQIQPGDQLTLEAEPTNQHDPYAVAAMFGSQRVGYLQKEVSSAAAWLLMIKMPLKVTVVSVGKAGNLVVNVLEDKP